MAPSRVQRALESLRGTRRRGEAPLLSAETAESLDRTGELYLRARTLVEGLYHGRHRTPDRGASTEFYDFRAYAHGDPIQRVDWRLFGRTDRLYVRRFHQDTQLTVMLVVDASASMDFAGWEESARIGERSRGRGQGRRPTKFRRARELAAALAYLTVRQADRVGLVISGRKGGGTANTDALLVIPPAAGWGALHGVIGALEGARCEGVHGVAKGRRNDRGEAAGAMAAGLTAVAHAARQCGLVVCIGDLLDEPRGFLDAAARLRYGGGRAGAGGGMGHGRACDVACVQVLTPEEIALRAPEGSSGARLIDPESAEEVRTDIRAVAERYRELVQAHSDSLRAGVAALGGRFVLCRTDEEPVECLHALLAQ